MSYNILITDISYLLQPLVGIPDLAQIYICLDINTLFPLCSEILLMNRSAKYAFYLYSYLYLIDPLIVFNWLNESAVSICLCL